MRVKGVNTRLICIFLLICLIIIILALGLIGNKNLVGYTIFEDSSLIRYWNFDDGTAKELSGNGNDGIVSGASFENGAFSFDGVNNYIELGDGLNQDFSSGFSVSVWANVKGGGAISNIIARTNGTRGARPFQLYYREL